MDSVDATDGVRRDTDCSRSTNCRFAVVQSLRPDAIAARPPGMEPSNNRARSLRWIPWTGVPGDLARESNRDLRFISGELPAGIWMSRRIVATYSKTAAGACRAI